jgi:hypothetical protein
VAGGWRRLLNELYNLYASPNVVMALAVAVAVVVVVMNAQALGGIPFAF